MHHTTPHHTTPNHTTPHHTTPHHTTPLHPTPPHPTSSHHTTADRQICILYAGRQASLRTDNTLLHGVGQSARRGQRRQGNGGPNGISFSMLTVGNCLLSIWSVFNMDKLVHDMRALQQLRGTTASKPHCTDCAALNSGCHGSLVCLRCMCKAEPSLSSPVGQRLGGA